MVRQAETLMLAARQLPPLGMLRSVRRMALRRLVREIFDHLLCRVRHPRQAQRHDHGDKPDDEQPCGGSAEHRGCGVYTEHGPGANGVGLRDANAGCDQCSPAHKLDAAVSGQVHYTQSVGAVADVDEALGRLEGIEDERTRIDDELTNLDEQQSDLDAQYEALDAKREALVASRDRADAEYTELYAALEEVAEDPSGQLPDPAAPRAIVPARTERASLALSQAFVPPIPPGRVWESGEVPALTEPVVQVTTATKPVPQRWKLWAGIGAGVAVVLMIIGISVSSKDATPEADVRASGPDVDAAEEPASPVLEVVGAALSPDAAAEKSGTKKRRKKRRTKRSRNKKSGAKATAKKSRTKKRRKKSEAP